MRIRRIVFRTLGLVFACIGILLALRSIGTFVQQVGQRDWTLATATITQTQERRTSSGGRRHSRSRTVYDMRYAYDADGVRYEGETRGRRQYIPVGGTIQIKYDPQRPEACTDILQPSVGALLLNIVFSALFSYLALAASGVLAHLRKKLSHTKKGRVPQGPA
nr:DUF3592 domain-containing protein [Maliibacterium massiliense]